jgi:cell division protein FtsW (lipid II flippase)
MEYVLFFHVLAAFALGATVVMYSAFALGAPTTPQTLFVADRLWDIGGLGTLLLGIWLALDDYSILDGWILIALALWLIATFQGFQAKYEYQPELGARDAPGPPKVDAFSGIAFHWMRTLVVLLLLLDMIFKPWA